MYLIFDTETTGLPVTWRAPVSQVDNWPRLVQLAWTTFDENGGQTGGADLIVFPEGFSIPSAASNIHGITDARARAEGLCVLAVLEQFAAAVSRAAVLVAHNFDFDEKIVGAELIRAGIPDVFANKKKVCTKKEATDFCELPGPYGFKWPTLDELYRKLFNTGFDGAHNAMTDVKATAKCFFELKSRAVLK